MNKFTFTVESEEGIFTSVFESENWVDTFPKYLNTLRGSGFQINPATKLLAVGVSPRVFDDREFLEFQEEHSKYYKDHDRNL